MVDIKLCDMYQCCVSQLTHSPCLTHMNLSSVCAPCSFSSPLFLLFVFSHDFPLSHLSLPLPLALSSPSSSLLQVWYESDGPGNSLLLPELSLQQVGLWGRGDIAISHREVVVHGVLEELPDMLIDLLTDRRGREEGSRLYLLSEESV